MLVLAVTAVALADDPTAVQAAGVIVIAIGVLCVRGIRSPSRDGGAPSALAIAGCIAAYTLVDNEGVRHAHPLPYLELLLVGPALLYAAALARLRGVARLRAETGWGSLAAAIAMFGSYALVLAALRLAPAAPVAAVRETSVLLAALLAVAVLGERPSRSRLFGAALVAGGLSCSRSARACSTGRAR